MNVGGGFLDQPAEGETRDDLRRGGDRYADEIRTVADDRMKKSFTEQLDVGILLFVPDDLHQVFGGIDGVGAELIVHDRQPGREIERWDDLQPLVDQEKAFPVGFHVVEAFAPEGVLRRFDAINQIREPIERFDQPRQMLGAAWPGFARPFALKLLLLIDQFLIETLAVGLGHDIVKQLDPEVTLRHIRHTGLGQEACERG